MKERSNLTKYLGISSLGCFILGSTMAFYSQNLHERFHNKHAEEFPALNKIKTLEFVYNSLEMSEKELSRYPLLTKKNNSHFNKPNPDMALYKIKSSRTELLNKDLIDKNGISRIDKGLKSLETQLQNVERNMGESHYVFQRNDIKELKLRTSYEIRRLNQEVPLPLLKHRNALDSQKDIGTGFASTFVIMGLVGLAGYALSLKKEEM